MSTVKGCTGLRTLLVPPSLTALDASGLGNLRSLAFATGAAAATGLSVLNLSGCRSLDRDCALLRALSQCRELDLCWCGCLAPDLITEGLRPVRPRRRYLPSRPSLRFGCGLLLAKHCLS